MVAIASKNKHGVFGNSHANMLYSNYQMTLTLALYLEYHSNYLLVQFNLFVLR